jgi:uncharacterized damage-inducible protein DinB
MRSTDVPVVDNDWPSWPALASVIPGVPRRSTNWHHVGVGEIELARATLDEAHRTFVENLRGVSLDEALDPAGGYRSILGIAKHAAAWSAVYYSYAFEPTPRHWDATDWPRGLHDRIEASAAYLGEVLAWFDRTYERWLASLAGVDDLDAPRPVHWGGTAPLSEIVAMVAAHWAYHAGEINAILAIGRGQAWEYGEEVEENHIATIGHRVRPAWMTDEQAAAFESHRDEAGSGGSTAATRHSAGRPE